MSDRTLLERATQGVLDKLAREAGGCFAPEGFSFGGCDDASPCWCRRRARELARAAVDDDWLPIDENTPRGQGEDVLLSRTNEDGSRWVATGQWWVDRWAFFYHDDRRHGATPILLCFEPTHWRPVPS